jgi:phospholipid/cholesterol/gamma-HCH transport system ATP-binding protein
VNLDNNEIRIRIGFYFKMQHFDSMTVKQNLAFTLKRHATDLTPEEIEREIEIVLESVGLAPKCLQSYQEECKRIALARTLILKPEVILYDEPTTGLDTITSREISELILDIKRKITPLQLLLHDMACAKLTADRIMILKNNTC